MHSVTVEEMREIDRRAIQEFGIPGIVLMENAGRLIFNEVIKEISNLRQTTVSIFCGKGNNGGDGYVVARHLLNYPKEHRQNIKIKLFLLSHKNQIKNDARINLDILLKMKQDIKEIHNLDDLEKFKKEILFSDLIVDGILGTGIKGKIEGVLTYAIEFINTINKPVIAIDIPSGLDANTGKTLGVCIKAKKTVTFCLSKKGFENPDAKEFLGELIVADIGIPRRLYEY